MSSVAQPYVPPDVTLDPRDAKQVLRKSIRAAREVRSPRMRAEAATQLAEVVCQIPDVAEATCVAVYASRPHEPGTLALLERLASRGARVLLPVLGANLQRDWADYLSPEDLAERAPGRPPEPSTPQLGPEALAAADVVLTPALAVDTSGARLGHGGGWYDRALDHVRPGVPVIALAFAEEVYDATERPLPREEHDVPVDAVATPDGWRWLRPALSAAAPA